MTGGAEAFEALTQLMGGLSNNRHAGGVVVRPHIRFEVDDSVISPCRFKLLPEVNPGVDAFGDRLGRDADQAVGREADTLGKSLGF